MDGFRNIFTNHRLTGCGAGVPRMLLRKVSGEDVPEYVKWVWMLEVKAQSHHGGQYHRCFAVEPLHRNEQRDDWVDNVAVQYEGPMGDTRYHGHTSLHQNRRSGPPGITWVCFEVNTGPGPGCSTARQTASTEPPRDHPTTPSRPHGGFIITVSVVCLIGGLTWLAVRSREAAIRDSARKGRGIGYDRHSNALPPSRFPPPLIDSQDWAAGSLRSKRPSW